MYEFWTSIGLALPQVLRVTEWVVCYGPMVFHCLLYHRRIRPLLLWPLKMQSSRSTIELLFFRVAESVVGWIYFPVIVSLFLLTGSIIVMSIPVPVEDGLVLRVAASIRSQHVLGIVESGGSNTICDITAISMFGPCIPARESFTEGLAYM